MQHIAFWLQRIYVLIYVSWYEIAGQYTRVGLVWILDVTEEKRSFYLLLVKEFNSFHFRHSFFIILLLCYFDTKGQIKLEK